MYNISSRADRGLQIIKTESSATPTYSRFSFSAALLKQAMELAAARAELQSEASFGDMNGGHAAIWSWLNGGCAFPPADSGLCTQLLRGVLSSTTLGQPLAEIDTPLIVALARAPHANLLAPIKQQIMGPEIPAAIHLLRFITSHGDVKWLLESVLSASDNAFEVLDKVYGREDREDQQGTTFLECAIRYNNLEAVKYLLGKGVSTSWGAELGGQISAGGQYTALHVAVSGRPRAGTATAQPSDAGPGSGSTGTGSSSGREDDIASLLIDRGLDVNQATTAHSWEYARTPLLIAATSANAATIFGLLECGAEPTIVDTQNCNLLHLSAGYGLQDPSFWAKIIPMVPSSLLSGRNHEGLTPIQVARQSYNMPALLCMARVGCPLIYPSLRSVKSRSDWLQPASVDSGGSAAGAGTAQDEPHPTFVCLLTEASTLHIGPDDSPLSSSDWAELGRLMLGEAHGSRGDSSSSGDPAGGDDASASATAGSKRPAADSTGAEPSHAVSTRLQVLSLLLELMVNGGVRCNIPLLNGLFGLTVAALAELSPDQLASIWPAAPVRRPQPAQQAFQLATFGQASETGPTDIDSLLQHGAYGAFWDNVGPGSGGAAQAVSGDTGRLDTQTSAPSTGQGGAVALGHGHAATPSGTAALSRHATQAAPVPALPPSSTNVRTQLLDTLILHQQARFGDSPFAALLQQWVDKTRDET